MNLTESEKSSITQMEQGSILNFNDEIRSNYQYDVEKPTENEYRVSKFALVICLGVEYFETPEEVINYIEK